MSHHTLLHRSLKPVVLGLAAIRVAPDQITLLRLLTGLGSAVMLAQGPQGLRIGAGLFLVSALLDRLDGALARRTGQFSRHGWRLDLIADCLSTMAFFIGLGIGIEAFPIPDLLPDRAAPWVSPALGLTAACGIALLFRQHGRMQPEGDADRVRPFDPDDVMVALPVLLWLDQGGAVLLAAGTLSPLAAASLWWFGRQRRSPA